MTRQTILITGGYGAFTLPSQTVDTATFVDVLRHATTELGMADGFQIS